MLLASSEAIRSPTYCAIRCLPPLRNPKRSVPLLTELRLVLVPGNVLLVKHLLTDSDSIATLLARLCCSLDNQATKPASMRPAIYHSTPHSVKPNDRQKIASNARKSLSRSDYPRLSSDSRGWIG